MPGVRRQRVAVLAAVDSVQGLVSLEMARGLAGWLASSGGAP